MPRVAVVGCGDVSIVHFEAIEAIADAELVAVCDSDPATLTETAVRYQVPGFADHHQLVDVVAPDVVHVCTPHHQHADIAIDCLRAGVGVLLEKPLAHTAGRGGASRTGRGRVWRQDRSLPPEPLQRDLASHPFVARLRSARCATRRHWGGHVASAGGVLPAQALAGSMGRQRRRCDDQPGHPHPGPVGVVPR